MLENLKTSESIQEQGDVLGGTYLLDSGLLDSVIDMAYVDESSGGALGVHLIFKGKKQEVLRQTIYITSGKAKGQKHTYKDKDGNDQYLPGFSQVNALCRLAVGKEISEMVHEEKTVNVYDATLKKEVPVAKQVMVDLIGAEITLGVIRQTVNKQVKSESGAYVPVAEARDENEIDKMFRSRDGLTSAEIIAGETEAVFKDKWAKKNTGVTRDKRTIKESAAPAGNGAPAGKSLFS